MRLCTSGALMVPSATVQHAAGAAAMPAALIAKGEINYCEMM